MYIILLSFHWLIAGVILTTISMTVTIYIYIYGMKNPDAVRNGVEHVPLCYGSFWYMTYGGIGICDAVLWLSFQTVLSN